MHTWSRRRARPDLEVLEERDLLAAAAVQAPYVSASPTVMNPPAQTDTTPTSTSSSEQDEYATPQPASVASTPHTTTAVQNSYDMIDWVHAARASTTNSSTSGQAATDNGSFVEAVKVLKKVPEQPSFPASDGPGQPDSFSGNEVLALPAPPTSVTVVSGIGFAGAAAAPNAEADFDDPLAAAVPLARLSAGATPDGREAAADLGGGSLDDLTPRLGTVLAGNLFGPRDLTDLGGRVGDFFAQLRSLENVPQETGFPLGLAPWLIASATAIAAWEFARRLARRPALLGLPSGDPSESLTWVRRPGSSSLSTEELS